jgi:hypothetical protein
MIVRHVAFLGLLVAPVAAAIAVAGCRGAPATSGCPGSDSSGTAIDAPVLAFLSAARALHHEADLREAGGDVPGALAALDRLVHLPAPSAVEVDEVLADAHARIAELRLGHGDLEGALRALDEGLRHAQGPTYFRGHLLEVQGRVEETRAAALADAGRAGEAAQARSRAMELLEEAVGVQDQVIERALGGASPPAGAEGGTQR